jgi:replicative DNA helicase
MNDQEQLPPHCELAEWSLVSCALEKPDILPDLDQTAFYCQAPRSVLERAQAMRSGGIADPQIPLLMELSRTNMELFATAQKALADLPSPENWTAYRDEIAELADQRDAMQFAVEIQQSAREGTLDPSTIGERAKRFQKRNRQDSTLCSQQCAERLVERIERRCNLRGARSGLVTGFDRFDDLTDGLQFGEQTIFAARPYGGKTALGCNIIERVCLKDRQPTALVTLEMSPDAISNRLLSSWATIPMLTLRTGRLNRLQRVAWGHFQKTLTDSPLYMVDGVGGRDINQVCTEIRRLHRQHGLKLVVIDYLQKIRPATKHEKRTYEVGEVSGLLRSLAVETGCAFVTLAQLNREPDKDKGRPPRLSDLADSGQIERDADCVGLLHRDRSKAEAMLIVAKQRDGEIGPVNLTFNGTYCRFENPRYEPPTSEPSSHAVTNDP